MANHLPENQYRGINAHLHSYLQRHGEWSIFHNEHVSDLRRAVQALLPPDSGYFVVSERSLQIVRDDVLSGHSSISVTRPDIAVYKVGETMSTTRPGEEEATAPSLTLGVKDTLVEAAEYISGVVIYRAGENEVGLGKAITRIELLSPANKPPGSHWAQYVAKREETLHSGINLVEIDYLHERRSPILILPDYPRREAASYPYLILVSNPHPSLEEGKTDIYGFRVDDEIPSISIPLENESTVLLDLGAAYQQTFTSNAIFGARIVDYQELPENFSSYDDFDRARIEARMAAVAEVQRQSD